MSEPSASSPGPGTRAPLASPLGMATLAAVSILAFGAIMVLLAFGEDLRPKAVPGAHAYSRSASGFAGLVELLRDTGRPVRLSQREETLTQRPFGLLILTPERFHQLPDLTALQGPTLIILPKWDITPDREERSWEKDSERLRPEAVTGVFDPPFDAELDPSPKSPVRLGNARTPVTVTSRASGPLTLAPDDTMQLLSGGNFRPLIRLPEGSLLAQFGDSDIYVLADPDPLANHGLDNLTHARFALDLIDSLRGDQEIIFDVTLAGFVQGRNGLKSMLTPPLLGVSLIVMASLALLFWAALTSFGARRREDPALRLGKSALIDSTVGLFTLARREGHFAPGFLALQRERLRRALSLPRSVPDADLTALLDRRARARGLTQTFTDWETAFAKPHPRRAQFLDEARAFHRWTRDMLS